MATDRGGTVEAQQTGSCAEQSANPGLPADGVAELATIQALAFPAAMLADLPRGFALRLRAEALAPRGHDCDFVVVTSKARYADAREAGIPAFTGAEWRVIAASVEQGRATRRELWMWLDAKRRSGSWTLTPERAFDAAFGCVPTCAGDPQSWSTGDVLARLHVACVSVEIGSA